MYIYIYIYIYISSFLLRLSAWTNLLGNLAHFVYCLISNTITLMYTKGPILVQSQQYQPVQS